MFQKGSPVVKDVSKAILQLFEQGELKRLEEKWLNPHSECSNKRTSENTESLKLGSFWVLYVISGATSTICFLLSIIHSLKSSQTHQEDREEDNGYPSEKNPCKRVFKLAKQFYRRKLNKANRRQGTPPQLPEIITISSPPTEIPEIITVSSPPTAANNNS